MNIVDDFEGGTPTRVNLADDGAVRCDPVTSMSGSQWFYWCVRVDGLERGATGRIDLHWPRRWTEADVPAGAERETVSRMTGHDSFAEVLPSCIHLSEDLLHWSPAENVEGDGGRIAIGLRGTGKPFYLATQIPYLRPHMDSLLEFARGAAPGCVRQIGRSQDGRPLWEIVLPATGGPAAQRPTIYVQAYQHLTEFSGLHVADALVRHLLGDAGASARAGLNWQILPCVDVDGLHVGVGLRKNWPAGHLRATNPNRDWVTRTWPEVAAIHSFLESQVREGTRYVAAFDLHNGWKDRIASGATYTVFPPGEADDGYIARQKDLIEALYHGTDHERPGVGHYWPHRTGGRTFTHAFKAITGGLASTTEFSRFLWWNRAKGAFEPARPDHPRRYARDMAGVLSEHFGNA